MIITNRALQLFTEMQSAQSPVPSKNHPQKQLENSKKAAFLACESLINADCESLFQMALALRKIEKEGLYQDTDKTFKKYCKRRWGMNPQFVDKLLEGAEKGKYSIDTLLQESGTVLPTGVHQLVAWLNAGGKTTGQLRASKKAVERAKASAPTPEFIAQTVEETKSKTGPQKPADRGDQQLRPLVPELKNLLHLIKKARKDVKKMSPADMKTCLGQIETGINAYLTDLAA